MGNLVTNIAETYTGEDPVNLMDDPTVDLDISKDEIERRKGLARVIYNSLILVGKNADALGITETQAKHAKVLARNLERFFILK